MKKNEVAKSTLLIQKEKELKDLQKQKEKTLKSIKTTKTKIANLQEEADSVSRDMMNGVSRMAELQKLAKELKALKKELFKKVKLSKQDKAEIKQVLDKDTLDDIDEQADEMFEGTPFGNAQNFAKGDFADGTGAEERYTDEFNRKRREAMFDPFVVKPNAEEQQQIRKVFLDLATRFHPDKGANAAEVQLFHDLMQRINAAYQRGDMDELLDIKARFADYHAADELPSGYDIAVLDVLDERLAQVKNELNLLNAQLLRVKEEFQNLNSSPLGDMVKSNRQAARYGEASASDLHGGTVFMAEMLTVTKTILTQWLETGKRPMAFNQMVDGSHPIIQKGIEAGHISYNAGLMDDDEDVDELLAQFAMMMQMSEEFENQKPRQGRKRR